MKIPVLIAASLLAFSVTAHSSDKCKVESVENMVLDTADTIALKVSIGPDKLRLTGHDKETAELRIRKCASSEKRMEMLHALQTQQNGTVRLELDYGGRSNRSTSIFGIFRSDDYGYFEISGSVPAHWNVDVAVGSGDAEIHNVARVNMVLGSGGAELRNIAGEVSATIGSGDLNVYRAGSLNIASIGSGDLKAKAVSGSAHIGSIGSGDAGIEDVSGDVTVGNIGSGDLEVKYVEGHVSVGNLGSGDIDAQHVEGDFTLRSKGSGSVTTSNINGAIRVPKR